MAQQTSTRQLWELAQLVRSKNAGPFTITIDIMFEDPQTYRHVKDSGVINGHLIAELYGLAVDRVRLTHHDAALAIKVSFPRRIPSGGVGDSDVFGGQFHGPLVELAIPLPEVANLAGSTAT